MRRFSFRRLLLASEIVLLTATVVVGIHTFVAQPYRVERGSMLDTLHEGEMVLVDKLLPHLLGVERGDIIVFHPPDRVGDDGTPFIKRVIGLPGDTVELRDGTVRVNGVALDESRYVYRAQRTEPVDGVDAWQVPEGQLFVLGDHRSDSTDSRTAWLGMVSLDRVIGRALVRYWPPEAATVLSPPAFPELRPPARAAARQEGPVTQASTSRR